MIGINKNEIIWVQYKFNGVLKFITTSDINRQNYFLYEVVDGKGVKSSHKNKDPTELEKWVYK